jgi:hypothetical protein
MVVTVIVLFGVLFLIAACASPEASRSRGGGPGADVGNRTRIVEMHEGSKPYEKTPRIIPAQQPATQPASRADASSRK